MITKALPLPVWDANANVYSTGSGIVTGFPFAHSIYIVTVASTNNGSVVGRYLVKCLIYIRFPIELRIG